MKMLFHNRISCASACSANTLVNGGKHLRNRSDKWPVFYDTLRYKQPSFGHSRVIQLLFIKASTCFAALFFFFLSWERFSSAGFRQLSKLTTKMNQTFNNFSNTIKMRMMQIHWKDLWTTIWLGIGLPENEESAIIYSHSYCSKPVIWNSENWIRHYVIFKWRRKYFVIRSFTLILDVVFQLF